MYKIMIPTILAIFFYWILLQISLEWTIFKNSMNYFIVFIIFFLFIRMVKGNNNSLLPTAMGN
ncbi:hypothetical protein DT035_00545 [Bacillus subtilis]|uniref:hypothetical protein n=1 Tax=Bacillus subtilis TaxID=1423 RepID=UPI00145A5994|nr:hypothetical protein [Bacillus subtilis]MBA5713312.1 hypothetical protein [Bacillus subtilis]